MRSLTELYTPFGLLADGDGDGQPDGFGCRFVVGRTPGAIDLAARLGLESAAFSPGFAVAGGAGLIPFPTPGTVPVLFGPDNPACPSVRVEPGCGIVAITSQGLVVTGADLESGWMAARWLASTFPYAAPGGPLLSEMAEGLPVRAVHIHEGTVFAIECDEVAAEAHPDKVSVVGAPPEPAFRAAAPGDLPPPGPDRLFTVDGLLGSSDSAQPDRTHWQVVIDPALTAEELAALCELAARVGVESTGLRFPVAVPAEEVEPGAKRVELAAEPHGASEWRQVHAGSEASLAWGEGGLLVAGQPEGRAEVIRLVAAEAGLVDGLHATLFTRRAALPEALVERGEPVIDLSFALQWEVERLRQLWAAQVEPRLRPGVPASVSVRLSEPLAVRRALAAELERSLPPGSTVRVQSAYKQGFHWLEEEALPRLQSLPGLARVAVTAPRFEAPAGGEGPRDGGPLELVIRWLQELYPADELLARSLGVPVDVGLAGEGEEAYQLTAYDASGQVLLQEGFAPTVAARPYLPEFPQRGWVHPPTGWLRVEQGGEPLLDQRLETDSEALWSLYQTQVLPALRGQLLESFGGAPDPAEQPFFGVLQIEASLSEEDRRLGIREEQLSPLDALHEDLYFYTLDYLNELGVSLVGKGYPAPGAVEPWVRPGEAGPQLRVRLYGRAAGSPPSLAAQTPEVAASLPEPASGIPMDRVIGPEQLPPYLSYLAGLPGVRVWRTGLSYGGRATWALSVTAPTAGRIAPPQKLAAWRPTLLVNARRHANEVSSTNSILKLAELAATTGLSGRLNLVLSPMENADGAAVHYAMMQEHPNWKLHAARFNAAGVDFGFDCFDPNPRFGESRTLPTLWRASLPDVVLDDHGYPSHEWVQPFSGWNSPPYFPTSWWMPNALIYGIYRWMDPERFPANHAVQERIRDALADRLTADRAIESYTQTLLGRYVTYGQRYVPAKFPLEQHKGFISLTRRTADGPEARTFVGRFPHITAAELVTEVPDETAQGDYLALCARAHLEGDLAVAGVLTAQPQPVARRHWQDQQGGQWIQVGRERPIRVEG